MNTIWLIGSGNMAIDYINVLKGLNASFIVIGRGQESAGKCQLATGHEVISGGLKHYLADHSAPCSHAIVAVGAEILAQTTIELLHHGVKQILVEKPAGLNEQEINAIAQLAKKKSAHVLIAYNRRFYSSVLSAKEIIEKDGGVTSFNFEFTEWGHIIEPLKKAEGVKEKWFFANSTHVVDLAFFLGGKPKQLAAFTSGSLSWHPSGSNFSGAGISENGALFSYQANWESAGRWSVEMLTKNHRLIFRPMEKLQIQKKGTIVQEFVESNDILDTTYKPGLYLQTKTFLNNDYRDFCSIHEQNEMMDTYNKIANY